MVPLLHCLLWFLWVNGPVFLLHTVYQEDKQFMTFSMFLQGLWDCFLMYVFQLEIFTGFWQKLKLWSTSHDSQSAQTSRVCVRSSDAGISVCMSVCVCVYVYFHTWKPFCWMWRNCSRSACMLLTILLWWPIRDTPILLTSLFRKQWGRDIWNWVT